MLPPATQNVPPSPSQSGVDTSPPGSHTTSCPKNKPCIQKITAKVPGTKGVRKAADKRPDDVLKESTSQDESLSSNPPVILVRGCNWVRLDSVTTPANQSVQWSVKPNENKESAPAIVPSNGGRSATLRTDKTGSFSVIGQVGDCKVVWNVVFVWVNVNTATSQISKRKNFAPNGAGGFSSGQFAVGQFAWDAQVKVKVIGGGNDQKLGIDKVKVKVLQNGVADTLTGNYAGGGKCLEVPKGGLPIVDANDASQPFVWLAPSASVTPNSGVDRTWFTGDSPGGGFPMTHQNTNKALQSISGVNGFSTAVSSVSDDAPHSIVVHAKVGWSADFSGTIDAAGNYTPTTAAVTGGTQFGLISANSGGADAFDVGFETFEPRFNGASQYKWTP